MPYNYINNTFDLTPEMVRLQAEKKAGVEIQERKHEDWDSNDELYRNKVKTNRLTQRQAVNIPLMKETIKTQLSKIDDPPTVDWKELSGDKAKEIIYQEIWNDFNKRNKLELIDVIDKKNVLLYGLSTKMLNITDNGIEVSVLDPYDFLIDPLANPWSLESARFLVRLNIFKCVRDILADERYSEEGKKELRIWVDSTPGLVQSSNNKELWEKKMERMKSMGLESNDFQYFAGGDRLVNLTEHFTNIWDNKTQAFVKYVITYADDKIELCRQTLKEALGVDFWPFTSWCEDPETVDVYPDSVADLVRIPNKVLNIWFSQLIENRTLKNFQMHWFLPGQNYTPQTYTPGPGMMLPAPPGDDINKVIKPVEISGLDDTLTAINQVIQIVERGSGAVAIDKGVAEKGTQTLGEVEILVGKAAERTTAMAKFYRLSWYEFAKKWDALMQANAPKLIKLHKLSRNGKLYPKSVWPADWKSTAGFEPTIRSTSEQEAEGVKGIQKWLFILKQFPNNQALQKIGQKRMLDIVDLTPQEMKEVEEANNTPAPAMATNPAEATPNASMPMLPEINQLKSA